MSELFLSFLNRSISAGWLILVIIGLRLVLKRTPKWVNVLLWGLVAIRLVFPFSLESVFSLIPSAETVRPSIMLDPTPQVHTGISSLNNVVNPVVQNLFTPHPAASANPLQILIPVAGQFWLLGMVVLSLYTLVTYILLRRRVSAAVRLQKNIYQCERIPSPFVLGLFRPRIYLPFGLTDQELSHVVAHEEAHIRRRDHWWKPLGFLLLTLYWFHPLMWVAYILLCRDIELACDEKVVRELGRDARADYSQALLKCSVTHRRIAACPLAFGEVGVKKRVRNILNYRKPAFWLVLISILLCMVVAVCFLTNPKEDTPPLFWVDYMESGTYPNETLELTLPEFPGVVFRCTSEAVQAEENGEVTTLISGMPVWNVYFCDLTGDEVPEFCATVSYGSGLIDEHIVVYDYAAKTEYTLWERGEFNYVLRQQEGTLICDRLTYPQGERIDTGELMLVHAGGGAGMRLEIHSDAEKTPPSTTASTVQTAPSPYLLTASLPAEEIRAEATFLNPSPALGALGYGFTKDERLELGALLNGLPNESFAPAEPFSPTIKLTLSWGESGSLVLYSDGQQTTFGEDQQWAIHGGDLNRFLEKMAYHQLDDSPNVLPLSELPPNYSGEAAMIDGVVTFQDGDLRENQSVWDAFLVSVSNGSQASVRLMHRSSESGSSDIQDLTYTGSGFVLDMLIDGTICQERYTSLCHFTGEVQHQSYDAYDYYVLTNDPDITPEELHESALSSQTSAHIPFRLVYTDLIYYPDQPTIPDAVTLQFFLDGKTLCTHTAPETIQPILEMMRQAVGLGSEPKTYSFGPELVFTAADGSQYPLTLTLEYDLFYLDGAFYDFGPGYTEDGSINATPDLLNLLFGSSWPEELQTLYEGHLS